ncbi:hypothetical protein, conserved [Leishmania tarentolae]|uniref:Uncharacterized protein n=1 Tax=Leishmania tarentolae TaxID=5689 RepID=A0A640KT57_LEITA|nr:hypothetical protein, conserved [Leishmania tarentolae]
MLGRKGHWQAALCTRRPRFLTGGFRPSPPSFLHSAQAPCLGPAAAPVAHESQMQPPTLAEVGIIHPTTSSPAVVLAAPSSKALETRVTPMICRHETLRNALGTRDAYRVFCALLRGHQTAVGASCSELEHFLSNIEGEADSLATAVCACVAVALSPSDWPPWVSARFAASGMAVMPIASNRAPADPGKAANVGEVAEKVRDVWTAASPLRATAACILHSIAARLPIQAACCSTSSPCLPLLKWLTLLCGVALAPSSKIALRLADEVSRVSLDAAGVALAAFCASHSLTAERTKDNSASVAVGHTRESWWLSLWIQLTQPGSQPPSAPLFFLDAATASPAVGAWSSGLVPSDLREKRISWHLHCLIASKEMHSAARLLACTCRDTSKAPRGTIIPVLASTQAELLSSLPSQLLEEDRLGEKLTMNLVEHLRYMQPRPRRPWSGSPHSLSFVPTVAASAVLYARMLQYLMISIEQVCSGDRYVQHLHNLSLLLSPSNIYALAASLVPADQPLATVMVAMKDAYREGHMKQLVGAVREVVDSLCEEPIPHLAAPAATDTVTENGVASMRRALRPSSVSSSEGVVPTEGKMECKVTKVKEEAVPLERAAANVSSAASWRWREDALSEVDNTVQAAVRFLTSLLELCSSRKNSLPLRVAEPKWRRELRERTAVRAHKFELLLQELPHAELRAMLQTLLGHGYIREGSQLGVSLVKGGQVDLRYYTLPLLGSLYLAVCAPPGSNSPAQVTAARSSLPFSSALAVADAQAGTESGKQAVYRMYRRRLEIYGNTDLNVTAPSYPPARDCRICSGGETHHRDGVDSPSHHCSEGSAAVATAALVRIPENTLFQELVLASTRPATSLASYATAELANCLLNRRVDVAGRGMVVDVGSSGISLGHSVGRGAGALFGPWLCTGVVTW